MDRSNDFGIRDSGKLRLFFSIAKTEKRQLANSSTSLQQLKLDLNIESISTQFILLNTVLLEGKKL